MQVTIVEKETGKLVGIYGVSLRGPNYEPLNEEYFAEAWRCAVNDGDVDADRRAEYSFSFDDEA